MIKADLLRKKQAVCRRLASSSQDTDSGRKALGLCWVCHQIDKQSTLLGSKVTTNQICKEVQKAHGSGGPPWVRQELSRALPPRSPCLFSRVTGQVTEGIQSLTQIQSRALLASASCYFKSILLIGWVLRPPSDLVLNAGYFLNLFQTLPSMKCKQGLSLASFMVRNI